MAATSPGISANDIRVCFLMSLTGGTTEGEMSGPPAPGDSDQQRTYKALLASHVSTTLG